MLKQNLNKNWNCKFLASPYRLRFELGGETWNNITQPVPRFLQAFQRAQAIANALFSNSTTIVSIIASWKAGNSYQNLQALGFTKALTLNEWTAPFLDKKDAELYDWSASEIQNTAMRDTLIWSAIVAEMPIEPSATGCMSFLVDFEKGLMLDIYDDRGMDVYALNITYIESLYLQFDNWLLDYDRPRMAAIFDTEVR